MKRALVLMSCLMLAGTVPAFGQEGQATEAGQIPEVRPFDLVVQQRIHRQQAQIYERQRWARPIGAVPYPADGFGGLPYFHSPSYAPYRHYAATACEKRAPGAIQRLTALALGEAASSDRVETRSARLGALVDVKLGSQLATSRYAAQVHGGRCDRDGYYFASSQTFAFKAPEGERAPAPARDYAAAGCRLAIAPAPGNERVDFHYVPVCPDGRGRYRFAV